MERFCGTDWPSAAENIRISTIWGRPVYRIIRRVLPAATCLTAPIASGPAAAQGWNMYQGNMSLMLPYTDGHLNSRNNDGSFSNTSAKIDINVGGSQNIPVIIDTGSTGIAISQHWLPPGYLNNLQPLGPGAYNYNSSGNTPAGTFNNLPVNILGGTVNGQSAVGSARSPTSARSPATSAMPEQRPTTASSLATSPPAVH
jgi:hypothetical protein